MTTSGLFGVVMRWDTAQELFFSLNQKQFNQNKYEKVCICS